MDHRAPHPDRQTGTPGNGSTGIATVVVGIDGSGTSWGAFCWGCGEARRLGGRAVAVFTSPGVDDGVTATTVQAEHLLAEMQREAAGQGLDLTFIHSHGDPATELLRVAEAVYADLIVVGKSVQVRHRIGGSVGGRLIRQRGAPVIVIVPLSPEIEDFRWGTVAGELTISAAGRSR